MKRLFLVILVVLVLGMSGCGPKAPSAAQLAEQQKAECFKTQVRVLQTMRLFFADSGTFPPIDIVVTKLHATCPTGGTYTFSETTEKVSCSVHGSPTP